MNSPSLPPLEYLLECSVRSLQSLELTCLDRSKHSLKVARMELEESVAQRECAGVARWLIDNRQSLLSMSQHTLNAASW
jgi:hypothetical protein